MRFGELSASIGCIPMQATVIGTYLFGEATSHAGVYAFYGKYAGVAPAPVR